jgi:two-component system response regulator YesN
MILLIVDDEKNIRTFMMNTLSRLDLGFNEILIAEDGLAALEISRQRRPEIIITDIVMPGLGGHDLAFEIQKNNPDSVIIFISGHDDVSYLQNAIDLHVFRYLLKPIDIDKLVDTIKLAMEENRKRRRQSFDTLFQSVYTLVRDHAPLPDIRREHLAILSKNRETLAGDISGAVIRIASLLLTVINEEQFLTYNGCFALLSSSCISQCASIDELIGKCSEIYDKLDAIGIKALELKHRSILENACAYIEEHYMENIGARDIAEYCAISIGYLSRLFNQPPYISVPHHITEVRLSHALDMIFEARGPLTEIARRCGFSSENYFSKLFRNRYGSSPSDIKKAERDRG